MVQLGKIAGFGEKRFHIRGMSNALRVRQLDGYATIKVVVVSKIDSTEPALA
jgi:hypothetical protein